VPIKLKVERSYPLFNKKKTEMTTELHFNLMCFIEFIQEFNMLIYLRKSLRRSYCHTIFYHFPTLPLAQNNFAWIILLKGVSINTKHFQSAFKDSFLTRIKYLEMN